MNHVETIKIVLTNSLNLGKRGEDLQLSSALLGALPELDSLALTTILIQLEEQFDFKIQDDEIDGHVFETLGSLANYVVQKISR
jgi:acyl carrier protein